MNQNMQNDPTFATTGKFLNVGDTAPDFEFKLTTGFTVKLSDLVNKAPVLINFIKGTWCPFCTTHMTNLRKWQKSLNKKNINIIVLSSEDLDIIRNWVKENQIDYMFGHVNEKKVFQQFGIEIEKMNFPSPATFLIEKDLKIRFSYLGKRDQNLETSVSAL